MDAPERGEGLVRRSMVRLRELLAAHYADEGRAAPVRIVLRSGCYLPEFQVAAGSEAAGNPDKPARLLLVERPRTLDGDVELALLALGLTEELIASLSGYADAFTAVHMPPADADPALSSDIVTTRLTYRLHTTLRRQADELRVSFQLLELPTARIQWSERFTLRLSIPAPFAVLEQVAQRVAATLLDPHGILYQSDQRHMARLPETCRALCLFYQYQEHFTRAGHGLAREALESSGRQEPDHAETWAALADVYLGEALFGFNPRGPLPHVVQRFVSTAQRAVALEPRNVMAHYILAMMLFYARREAEFHHVAERALRLAPNRPDNLAVIGMHRMLAGDWAAGRALVTRAMDLNPCHPSWLYLALSLHALHHHRYDEALAVLSPFTAVEFFPFQINLAVIHGYPGQREEAQRCQARMFRLWPEAAGTIDEILDFWFPYGELAAIFREGLAKVGQAAPREGSGDGAG